MRRKKYLIHSLMLFGLLASTSCIEEVPNINETKEFENTALVLSYIESQGGFLTSQEFPALVNAPEVFNNINRYFIIDVRSSEEYASGHIPNSVNVGNEEVFDYVNNLNTGKKILLVSNTGQSSAFYMSLLRYYGHKNIFSLNYGIATWNNDFASLWTNFFDKKFWDESGIGSTNPLYNDIAPNKPSIGSLPEISFNAPELSVKENIELKIKDLFNKGFDELSYGNIITENTIDVNYLACDLLIYDCGRAAASEYFIICYGNSALYQLPNIIEERNRVHDPRSHIKGAVLYNAFYPISDFKSTTTLQTLPKEKTIVIYSFSGQLSAMAVAKLKLLGYDAKSIIYGAHNMFYGRLFDSEFLSQFGLSDNGFNNFPYN